MNVDIMEASTLLFSVHSQFEVADGAYCANMVTKDMPVIRPIILSNTQKKMDANTGS